MNITVVLFRSVYCSVISLPETNYNIGMVILSKTRHMPGDGYTKVFIIHIYQRVGISALHIYSNKSYPLQLHPNTYDWHIFGPFRKPEIIG